MITPTAAMATTANATNVAMFGLAMNACDRARGAAHDAGEDDEADAVADAALGDQLADPHQGDGAGGQGRDLGQRLEAGEVEPAGQDALRVEQGEEAVRLEDRQRARSGSACTG